MSAMQRREFLRLLALASAAGASLRPAASAAQAAGELYDLPAFGNLSLLHMTDSHAQLLPVYFREPVGKAFAARHGLAPGSAAAHAFTSVDFERAARRYGKVGGYAHLATLVQRLRASRPSALLLDGGDTWQGSATALWTEGADMIGAQKLLGVDLMTAHWEFTYGSKRMRQAVDGELAPMEFLAQNVKTADFEDPVFQPYRLQSVHGVALAVIGQAFPYTPIANPRHFVAEWTFGIQEESLQRVVDAARSKGFKILLSIVGNPDQILPVADKITVASNSPFRVERFEIANGLKQPRWLRALQLNPSDRRVVRYAAIYETKSGRWLGTWTPSNQVSAQPAGAAVQLPAGGNLTMEIGYRGNPEGEFPGAGELGLYFLEKPPAQTATAIELTPAATSVAAGKKGERVRSEMTIKTAANASALWPRLGPGATSVEITALRPDGTVEPMLWLNSYRTEWPTSYILKEPVALPAGTRLVMTAYYDNATQAAVQVRPALHITALPPSRPPATLEP